MINPLRFVLPASSYESQTWTQHDRTLTFDPWVLWIRQILEKKWRVCTAVVACNSDLVHGGVCITGLHGRDPRLYATGGAVRDWASPRNCNTIHRNSRGRPIGHYEDHDEFPFFFYYSYVSWSIKQKFASHCPARGIQRLVYLKGLGFPELLQRVRLGIDQSNRVLPAAPMLPCEWFFHAVYFWRFGSHSLFGGRLLQFILPVQGLALSPLKAQFSWVHYCLWYY